MILSKSFKLLLMSMFGPTHTISEYWCYGPIRSVDVVEGHLSSNPGPWPQPFVEFDTLLDDSTAWAAEAYNEVRKRLGRQLKDTPHLLARMAMNTGCANDNA